MVRWSRVEWGGQSLVPCTLEESPGSVGQGGR